MEPINDLTLVIISYNSGAVIQECLGDLIREVPARILVVDNASRAGDIELLTNSCPQAEVLALKHNLGYGRATNAALKQITTPYALLINPDLKMTLAEVEALLKAAKNKPEGAIWGPGTSQKHLKMTEDCYEQRDISGSCMLLDVAKVRDELGGFDENIFLFSEEVDLCWRARKSGYKVLLFPHIYVEHLAGKSSGSSDVIEYMKNWHSGWSQSYFFHKHGIDRGKKALRRRLWLYSWKALVAKGHYSKVKYPAIRDGIRAYKRGEMSFKNNGMTPRVAPGDRENPYVG